MIELALAIIASLAGAGACALALDLYARLPDWAEALIALAFGGVIFGVLML